MRRAAVGFGDPERPSGGSLAGRLPQVSVSVRPVVGVDVVGVEVGPGFVREHALGVGGRRHGRGGVPADDDLRITGLEPKPRGLLPRTHLVHRVRAEGGDVGLVPRLPRRDAALEAHGQRPTQFIHPAEIGGEPAAGLGLGLRPGRRVVEDLKHLQARSPLRVRGAVVGGGRWLQRAGSWLDLPPAQPVADPAHARKRGEVGQLLLFPHVIVREPGGGGINRNRRVLRCAGLQRSQNGERSPALVGLIGGTEFQPVPADTQELQTEWSSGIRGVRRQRAGAQHLAAVIQQAPLRRGGSQFWRQRNANVFACEKHVARMIREWFGQFAAVVLASRRFKRARGLLGLSRRAGEQRRNECGLKPA